MLIPRLATEDDIPSLLNLMKLAIDRLQSDFLSTEQIIASHAIMGLDTQLIADRTYFVLEQSGVIAGCGGWSHRATLYGGDHSTSLREPGLLDPATDPARIRAMYTNPEFKRRGVGRRVLSVCECAARAEGFIRAELMATLAGAALYKTCGYEVIDTVSDDRGGTPVPLVRMRKAL
ncbi:GNAT family N-acetyltransferase [Asticcacaulis sp. DXS10W]|uniref:GNAT family N-acetyltransferase n=1 Tax=Asticcacaulis currens TaxID=2984210 RepID=A0ABT5IFI1_9CAUL|nr:GNAT family N-acetyltransferase [Asticcacaulis currens]MDC7694226.1 GNAT family N-acetyltransferase [Asticcacaulis currens]